MPLLKQRVCLYPTLQDIAHMPCFLTPDWLTADPGAGGSPSAPRAACERGCQAQRTARRRAKRGRRRGGSGEQGGGSGEQGAGSAKPRHRNALSGRAWKRDRCVPMPSATASRSCGRGGLRRGGPRGPHRRDRPPRRPRRGDALPPLPHQGGEHRHAYGRGDRARRTGPGRAGRGVLRLRHEHGRGREEEGLHGGARERRDHRADLRHVHVARAPRHLAAGRDRMLAIVLDGLRTTAPTSKAKPKKRAAVR